MRTRVCRSTARACLRLRDRMRDQAGDDVPITPFVLTLRLLTIALAHHPNLNSTWVDTTEGPQIHLHSAVHLGFGVAAPRGLLVPVVKDAQDKTTRELADVVARLIEDARAGTLRPAELQGSTFTVSNFGALGLDDGVPGDQLPRGGDPRDGLAEAARRRRRRRSRGAADDVADVCVRPSHRRRRTGRGILDRTACPHRGAGTGAARPLGHLRLAAC